MTKAEIGGYDRYRDRGQDRGVDRPILFEDRDRSNFNKIRDELAASFRKSCTARRTAFSNVAPMVMVGE